LNKKKAKLKKLNVTAPPGFEPTTHGFGAMEHLGNRMRNENCGKLQKTSLRHVLKETILYLAALPS